MIFKSYLQLVIASDKIRGGFEGEMTKGVDMVARRTICGQKPLRTTIVGSQRHSDSGNVFLTLHTTGEFIEPIEPIDPLIIPSL